MTNLNGKKKAGRDKTLRAGEVARLLDCSPGSIHRWTTECGLFTAVPTPGGQNVYWRSEVLAVRARLNGEKATQRRVERAFALIRGEVEPEPQVVEATLDVVVKVPVRIIDDALTVASRPVIAGCSGSRFASKAALERAQAIVAEVLDLITVEEVTQ